MKAAAAPGKWVSIRRWLPGVVISLVAIFLLLRLVEWQELKSAFSLINPFYLLAAAGMTVLFVLVRAVAWRILLNGRPTVGQAFLIINEGYLINNILPFRAGELGRAVFMGRAAGVSPFHVLSTIIIERVFDLVLAAVLLLSTLPLALGMESARTLSIVVLIGAVIVLVVLFLMARFHQTVAGWMTRLAERSSFIKKYILPQAIAVMEGLSVLNRPQQFIFSFGLIAFSWLLAVTQYYFLLLPFAPHAPFWWGVFTDSVLAMGIALPSAPAAIGVFEGSIMAALAVLGVASSSALAYAISLHAMQFIVTGIFGLVGFVKEGESFSHLFADLKIHKEAQN